METKNKMKIPNYINCKTNTIPCEFYLSKKCEERCPYAMEMKLLGVGAMDTGLVKGLAKILSENKHSKEKQ